MEVAPQGFDLAAPTRGILSDDQAHFLALAQARDLLKVNLALETRAREAAGISGQRPADGVFSLAVVEYVLLGDVRVVVFLVRFEAAGLGIEFDGSENGPYDALERVHDCSSTKRLDGVSDRRGSAAQAHGVVIAIGESETKHQPTSRLDAECVDQLFSQQSHRRRAQDHDALVIEPDNALVRAKVEQFGELKRFGHEFTIPWGTRRLQWPKWSPAAHQAGKCFGQDRGFDGLDEMLLETRLDRAEPMVAIRINAESGSR
jgi:hypothetical protein